MVVSGTIDAEFLAAAFNRLPLAIGAFDRRGRYVMQAGALRTMLSDAIPSRSRRESKRWHAFDEGGLPLGPKEFPCERALRGETVFPGVLVVCESGDGCRQTFVMSAFPFDHEGFQGGISVLQKFEDGWSSPLNSGGAIESRELDAVEAAVLALSGKRPPQLAPRQVSSATEVRSASTDWVPDTLSARETEVLRQVAWGFSHKEIAAQFAISVKTVDFHRRVAAEKLKLRSRTDIIRYALGRGWLHEG